MVTWHVKRVESQANTLAQFLRDAAEFGEVFGCPDEGWINDFKSYNNDRRYEELKDRTGVWGVNAVPLPPSATSSGSKDTKWKMAHQSSTRLVHKSPEEAVKVMRAQEWEVEEDEDLLQTAQGSLIPEGQKTPKLEPRREQPKGYWYNCQVFPDEC